LNPGVRRIGRFSPPAAVKTFFATSAGDERRNRIGKKIRRRIHVVKELISRGEYFLEVYKF
jgi:hypothetical protein